MRKAVDSAIAKIANTDGSAEYEVGYCKPPAHSRFEKGQSGNPKGRPKGARGKGALESEPKLKEILLKEAQRTTMVHDGGRKRKMSFAQIIVKSLITNAAKGNTRSQKITTDLLIRIEGERERAHDLALETLIQHKVYWEDEIERCRAQGLPDPVVFPHPDHIHIDFSNDTAEIRGPMARKDAELLDTVRLLKDQNEGDLQRLLRKLKRCKGDSTELRNEIAKTEKTIARCQEILSRNGMA